MTAAGLVARVAPGQVGRTSLWLLLSTGVSALFGYVFWFVLARAVDQEAVGEAGTVVPLIGWFAALVTAGLVPTLTSVLGRTERSAWTSTVGPFVAAALTGIGALGAVAVTATLFGMSGVLAFVVWAAVAGTVMVSLVDAVAVVARSASTVLVRSVGSAVLRLAFPVAVVAGAVGFSVVALVSAWALVLVPGLVFVLWWLRRTHHVSFRPSPLVHLRAGWGNVGWNQLASLAAQLPAAVLPAVVAARAGTQAAGGFYLVWLIASSTAMLHTALTPPLIAEAAVPERRAGAIRHATRTAVMLGVPAVAVTVGFGYPVLGWLGDGYAAAFPALVVLAVGSGFDAATALTVAVWRTSHRERPAALLNVGMAVVAVGGAWLLAPAWGVTGAATAFVAAQAAGCIAVLPALVRQRNRRPSRS